MGRFLLTLVAFLIWFEISTMAAVCSILNVHPAREYNWAFYLWATIPCACIVLYNWLWWYFAYTDIKTVTGFIGKRK